jgi:serine/threonine-protein kinase
LLTQIVLGKIEPPSKFAPDLPAGWDDVLMKGLAPNPEDRYASAEEMAEAIESIGAVATSRAVGQWISSLASESIARRAEAVRQIEQNDDASAAPSEVALASLLTPGARARAGISSPNASAPDIATPASESARTASARDPELSAGATSLPSHMVGVGSSRDRSRSKLATPIVLAVAGLVVLGGLAIFAKTRGTSDGAATNAAAHDVPTTETASAASTATSGPTVLPGAPVPPASTPASAVAASAAPSSRPASPPAIGAPPHPPNVATPPAATPKPPAKADCSSPFYVDANGDRHVKRECL